MLVSADRARGPADRRRDWGWLGWLAGCPTYGPRTKAGRPQA
ncbi:hypothetical protein OG365_13250 [Streptomyces sp. NBC_00853]|nr:hypothetical protein OG365_13250 [Streptomyces sp. NBC_00853]